ncbi:hypothetical protein NPX13_g1985 [Xylaria arbuscula]|uniref:Heterokaryon incompatibility domain-containing protein n=1 Tax=Xylaria arbuscula TaxID=114810 RepID=A0A9W8NL10_9PEZI|nr:hypothetical protein NPX13_g1985 [Xylaria arbuscula]
MWLIDTSTLQLKSVTEADKGSYAVLSHTWGDDEVTFEQFRTSQIAPENARQNVRFSKIIKTCELAAQHGLSYAWIDTCCIDKSSSAELSEAINSMFRYYENAAFCIAFISDLPGSSDCTTLNQQFASRFPQCRWLTRGWTLQEMIAPPRVLFYDSTWAFRGSKNDWKSLLSKETGVNEAILDNSMELRLIPVAQRMCWASKRRTTRVEDTAYCLMGIFDVNMPLIYGEGKKAFTRLQEEIAKQSYDLSLFAWQQVGTAQNYRGILASSPEEFFKCGGLKHRIRSAIFPTEFTLTNRGLRTEGAALANVPTATHDLIWNLGFSYRDGWPINTSQGWIGIYLAKTQNGFVRARPSELFEAGFERRIRCPPRLIHVRKMVDLAESCEVDKRFERAIKVELHQSLESPQSVTLKTPIPETLWVENEATFLHQGRGINAYIRGEVQISKLTFQDVIFACSTMDTPVCAIIDSHDHAWSEIDTFLTISNERADFVAADYLRAQVPHEELSSKAMKKIKIPGTESFMVISAELNEYTSDKVEMRFTWRINALLQQDVIEQDDEMVM